MERANKDILRLLDANMNRAVEGIRVLEEVSRMIFDDRELTTSIKDIRHKLVQIISEKTVLTLGMIEARDSEHDVLRNGETISEQTRDDLFSIVKANASRSQEAVRAMEEFAKLSFPGLSERFKHIRFRIYDVEKSLILRIKAQKLIDKERLSLYVEINNDCMDRYDVYEAARSIIDDGAGALAYNDQMSSDREFLANIVRILEACGEAEITTIINSRLDAALIAGADGVHLGRDDMPVDACRSIAGEGFVIGSTISSLSRPNNERINGLDFIIVEAVLGESNIEEEYLSILRHIVSVSPVPVLAMGGITLKKINDILECGITGIALKYNLLKSGIRNSEIRKFRECINAFN